MEELRKISSLGEVRMMPFRDEALFLISGELLTKMRTELNKLDGLLYAAKVLYESGEPVK